MSARRLSTTDDGFEDAFEALLGLKREASADVDGAVAAIVADVIARGDTAVVELTRRFDRYDLTVETMRVTSAEIDAAIADVPAERIAALETAARRIRDYHWPMAPIRSHRSMSSPAPETPMSPPRSVRFSARLASIRLRGHPKSS